jgi:antibiotic biosynthesis monooxygenase (ABM) superfamily enzyme
MHGNEEAEAMTSFVGAVAERTMPSVRGKLTVTERAPAAQRPVRPPRWKVAMLTWLGVFPLVTAMVTLGKPLLDPLPLVARTFALTAVVVPVMVFVVTPALTRAFQFWLQR